MSLPPFSALPLDKKGPQYNAWGLYGKEDELGRLNLITQASVRRGRDSIQHGIRVNLNLPLDVTPMNDRRTRLQHEILSRPNCNDDTLHFNTQTSTQWDGFRHYGYQDWPQKGINTHYGGMSSSEANDRSILHYGTQNYAKYPITSRGVLLDIPRYLEFQSLPPLSPLNDSTPITPDMLEGCAKYEGVTFESGDVLIVRTGWAPAFDALSEEEKKSHRNKGVGVARGAETLKWHWEKGISAVASDVRAYEVFPHEHCGLSLHEVFLGGWGMPIGELFDLEELGARCAELKQWAFMFTSMALYVDGGIASPPNAQAIL